MRYSQVLVGALLIMSVGCKARHEPKTRAPLTGSGAGSGTAKMTPISRADYNRFAVRLNLPIFWIEDRNHDGTAQKDELTQLLFYPAANVDADEAYAQIVEAWKAPPLDTSSVDGKRRELVRKDLDAGRATVLYDDMSAMPEDDKAFVRRMIQIAQQIDDLFETTNGAAALRGKLPADPESQSMFRRNRGPQCEGPMTAPDPACSAIPGSPKLVYDLYPPELQLSPTFCKDLEARKDGSVLLGHFNVVRGTSDKLEAVPYHIAYKERTTAISNALIEAARGVKDPSEKPLVAYLEAAAKGFVTDDWGPADEAWANMSVDNSKWYVRIAPDEVYWEPCAAKAGYHLTFARINQSSRAWQQKLVPIRQEMEAAVGALAGAPYKTRTVTFHLPDFIDIVLNAGEDRHALSTSLGQSLPNWGPIVDAGRGRTWAALNIGTDADSMAALRAQAGSVFDAATMAVFPAIPDGDLLSTILHETTHNLGPAHDYKVGGKTAPEIFGGTLASMLEELKAQIGALFLAEMLRSKGLITEELARDSYVYSVIWAFGHISQGMYAADKSPKPYGQLAAIMTGQLIDSGVLTWSADAKAANGSDVGAFTIHFDKLVPVAADMMKDITGILARGDKGAADHLLARYVDAETVVPHRTIAERLLREPRYSHVYSVRF